MKMHKIVALVDDAVSKPYEYGTNDCNIIVLKLLDLMVGTDYLSLAEGKYKTLQGGLRLFKKNDFKDLEDMVSRHCEVVDRPILGDIYLNGINASVFLHNTMLQINYEHNQFYVSQIPEELEGKIYRIRK